RENCLHQVDRIWQILVDKGQTNTEIGLEAMYLGARAQASLADQEGEAATATVEGVPEAEQAPADSASGNKEESKPPYEAALNYAYGCLEISTALSDSHGELVRVMLADFLAKLGRIQDAIKRREELIEFLLKNSREVAIIGHAAPLVDLYRKVGDNDKAA